MERRPHPRNRRRLDESGTGSLLSKVLRGQPAGARCSNSRLRCATQGCPRTPAPSNLPPTAFSSHVLCQRQPRCTRVHTGRAKASVQ